MDAPTLSRLRWRDEDVEIEVEFAPDDDTYVAEIRLKNLGDGITDADIRRIAKRYPGLRTGRIGPTPAP